jgi:hypothetical protein
MNYDEQALAFLSNTGTTFKCVYVGHDKYFHDDKESRDIYRITLDRYTKRQTYEFTFGQSLAKSYPRKVGILTDFKGLPPKPYDVLACLTKYDPGTFEDFCSDFGYDTDSRRALDTYLKVQDEYQNVIRLFGDVMEQLQEIE